MQWHILSETLLETLLALLLGGAALSLIVGVWLYLYPERLFSLSQRLNKWFSTQSLTRPMDATRYIERTVYHNHRWVGALFIAGAVYVLYQLGFNYDKTAILRMMQDDNPQLASWLLDSAAFIIALTSVLTLIVGICLVIRPSLLRPFETWSNRWYSGGDKLAQLLDRVHHHPDRLAARHPRFIALLIVLGSLYALTSLGFIAFTHGWGVLSVLYG
jgi:hypothetical protein